MGTIINNPSYYSEETEKQFIIHALDLTIDQQLIPGAKDLIVRAYNLTIKGPLIAHSRNIELYVQTLIGEDGALVDVSGEAGVDRSTAASDGRAPGQGGSNGEPGGAGRQGGNVRIVAKRLQGRLEVRANGGRGGRGQRGGNGVLGAMGAGGQDAVLKNDGPGATQGGTGGTGGGAGRGGSGGAGGDSGIIDLAFIELPPPDALILSAEVGLGGDAGTNGSPGDGGPGGPGGLNRQCDRVWD